MGNNESVTAGNKAQADVAACAWYEFLALTGDGRYNLILVETKEIFAFCS